jgi:hypothetical protein
MKRFIPIVLILIFSSPTVLLGQSDTVPEGVGEEAAEALGEDRGKTEEEQLEEILSSEQNEYDLINQGNFKVNYSFNYNFNSNVQPRQAVRSGTDAGVTVFNLQTDSQHTVTHRLSTRFGFRNNITVGANIPIVTKWNSTNGEATGNFGDMSFSARYDPFITRPGEMSMTFSGSLTVPTGKSPWEINQDERLSTGSGGFSFGGGMNVSKTVDPVVAFGSLSFGWGLPITGLNQRRSQGFLTEVRPGPSFGFGMGMAYSLSYDVSLTMNFNYNISLPTDLVFKDFQGSDEIREIDTSVQTSSIYRISTGWRLSPEYIANVGVGIGLTENSPDMNFSVSLPLVLNTPLFNE